MLPSPRPSHASVNSPSIIMLNNRKKASIHGRHGTLRVGCHSLPAAPGARRATLPHHCHTSPAPLLHLLWTLLIHFNLPSHCIQFLTLIECRNVHHPLDVASGVPAPRAAASCFQRHLALVELGPGQQAVVNGTKFSRTLLCHKALSKAPTSLQIQLQASPLVGRL